MQAQNVGSIDLLASTDERYDVKEEDWELCSMHDATGRRGIWFRYRVLENGQYVLEIRGGREGDDEHVALHAGDTLTIPSLQAIRDALAVGAWALRGAMSSVHGCERWPDSIVCPHCSITLKLDTHVYEEDPFHSGIHVTCHCGGRVGIEYYGGINYRIRKLTVADRYDGPSVRLKPMFE